MEIPLSSIKMCIPANTKVYEEEPSEIQEPAFPIETLPVSLQQYVKEQSEALSTPIDLVALPVLAAAGAAIGNGYRIQAKAGWNESAALYGGVVSDPASMKSPALDEALRGVHAQNSRSSRTWTSDVTVERLTELLQGCPRGLIIIRDELAGWFRSMNQYRSGRGADVEFYCSAWGNQPYTVDRKTDKTGVTLPAPFLSVIGAIPTEVLKEIGAKLSAGSGFLERFLWVLPESRPVRWTKQEVRPSTRALYEQWIQYRYSIPFIGTPLILSLTPEAQGFFEEWHDAHMQAAESPSLSLFLQGSYGKLKGYCLRLALIHALYSEATPQAVGLGSVTAAAGNGGLL